MAVLGAPRWQTPSLGWSEIGAAYVFLRDDQGTPSDRLDDTWTETAKIMASDSAHRQYFGSSVSLDGDRLLIGATHEDIDYSPGKAYLFERDDSGTPADPFDDTWVV